MRSCENCINKCGIEIKPDWTPLCVYVPCELRSESFGWIATICRHYTEQPEPSAFDEAWSDYLESTMPEGIRSKSPHEIYRAGWNAGYGQRGDDSNCGRGGLVKYHKGTPYYQFDAIEQMESELTIRNLKEGGE